jgi:hypothetical protein
MSMTIYTLTHKFQFRPRARLRRHLFPGRDLRGHPLRDVGRLDYL